MVRLKMWTTEHLKQEIRDIDKQLPEISESNPNWLNHLKSYQKEMKDELKRRETITQNGSTKT